jgi:hypothetical protein
MRRLMAMQESARGARREWKSGARAVRKSSEKGSIRVQLTFDFIALLWSIKNNKRKTLNYLHILII